jgi:hypothetical protein
MTITDLKFTVADGAHRASGILGWVKVTFAGAVIVDGIALRRTLTGDLAITWPTKPNGRPVASPASTAARKMLEARILDAVAAQLEATL